MIGNNQIHMNQDTMKQAVQLWLDANFKKAPKCRDVAKNTNSQGALADQFIVSLQGDDAPTERKSGG